MTDVVWQNARIVRIDRRTPRIRSFFLELQRPFTHRPGQHVDVRLTAPDGYQAKRSYSMASAPDASGTIELAIDRLEDGEVSSFFHDVAIVGDDVEVRGPLGGHFTWKPQDGGPVMLIAGGSGLVPLMSMVRAWKSESSKVPVALLLAARRIEEALYLEELKGISNTSPGLTFRTAFTREPAAGAGDYGRRIDADMIADLLVLLPSMPRYAFICGSNGFANAATEAALAAGLDQGTIRTERYGG